MRCRWSNGVSAAVEFNSGPRKDFRRNLINAAIEYRRIYGSSRIELHVEAVPGRWTDPAFRLGYGYVHVIDVQNRMPADADGVPKARHGNYVLIVDAANISSKIAESLYRACMGAIQYCNEITGSIADIVESVEKMAKTKKHEREG